MLDVVHSMPAKQETGQQNLYKQPAREEAKAINHHMHQRPLLNEPCRKLRGGQGANKNPHYKIASDNNSNSGKSKNHRADLLALP